MNTVITYTCLTMGLQVACYTLIGKTIGARDVKQAIRFRKILTIMGISLQFIMSASIYFSRFMIAEFFTNIEELQLIVGDALRVIALVCFFDCC